MAIAPPVPRTLDAWVKSLANLPLPVAQSSHERVRATLDNNLSSVRDIADAIQVSPALALCVLREANQQGEQLEPAESLETALNRLGLKRVGKLLMRLPSIPEEQMPLGLRQLQLIGQHATQQANGLFAGRLARLWQEIHWGSLLFLSPLWPLALAHPKRLEDWESRVIHKHESAHKVELDLFGVPLLQLCLALTRHWRLPAWIAQGYETLGAERDSLSKAMRISRADQDPLLQQQRLDDDPNLRRWLNQPAHSIVLATGVALAAQEAWNTPHMLRWQRLISLYLQMPLADVQQNIHQQAVLSATQHAHADLWHPAQALIWPWTARRPRPQAEVAPAPNSDALNQWRKRCVELLTEPSPFTNAIHLTTYAKDTLLACGMQRVLLLMPDRTQSSLRVQQSAGVPDSAAGLSLLVSQSTVLQRLLSQATPLRLTPTNHAQFCALLPGNLTALFEGQHVLLRSLAVNGRVVILLIADQGGQPFADVSVQAFGKTAQCVERALAIFASRKS